MAFINKIKLLLLGRRGPNYDSDAAAGFAVVNTLTPAQKTAINNFIVGMKADNNWDFADAIYLNAGTTIAHYAYDWKNKTSDTSVNNPVWTATGTQYNGANNYFRGRALSSATQLTTTSASFFMFCDPNSPFNSSAVGGAINGLNNFTLQVYLIF